MRALLRRRPPRGSAALVVGDLLLNPDTREVSRGEREIELTNREFELLEYLMRNERLVVSRERLLEEVWGYDPMAMTNTIDVFISNLRRKLEAGRRAAAAAHQARRRLRAARRRGDARCFDRWPVRWRIAGISAGLTLLILLCFALVVGRLATDKLQDDFEDELQSAANRSPAETASLDPTRRGFDRAPDRRLRRSPTTRGPDRRRRGRPARLSTDRAADLGPPQAGARPTSAAIDVATAAGPGTQPAGPPIYVQYAADPRDARRDDRPALVPARRRRARRHPARAARRARGRRPGDAPDRLADRRRARDRRRPATPRSGCRCPRPTTRSASSPGPSTRCCARSTRPAPRPSR